MAIIYSYPKATPKASDLLIGTVTYEAGVSVPVQDNPTRTFSIGDIADLVSSYTLSSAASGTNATLVLTNNLGNISAVNLVRGSGISIVDNGSNSVTISSTGIVSANSANTNYINTSAITASGVLTISSSLSATGAASSSNYLRGDNVWATPVNFQQLVHLRHQTS